MGLGGERGGEGRWEEEEDGEDGEEEKEEEDLLELFGFALLMEVEI